ARVRVYPAEPLTCGRYCERACSCWPRARITPASAMRSASLCACDSRNASSRESERGACPEASPANAASATVRATPRCKDFMGWGRRESNRMSGHLAGRWPVGGARRGEVRGQRNTEGAQEGADISRRRLALGLGKDTGDDV